jgi:hypothetical protein
MGAPAESFSLISYLPAPFCCLRLRGVHFSYLSGLECTFAKDDLYRQEAPITFSTADPFAGRRIPGTEFSSREQTRSSGRQNLPWEADSLLIGLYDAK